jgi:putative ABC transport system permease protein
VVSEEMIETVRSSMPELPEAKRERFGKRVPADTAFLLTSTRDKAEFFEASISASDVVSFPKVYESIANTVVGDLTAQLNDANLSFSASPLSPEELAVLQQRVADGTISGKIAKELLKAKFEGEASGIDELIDRRGLRLTEPEISEIAVRLKDPRKLDEVSASLAGTLSAFTPNAAAKAGAAEPARKGAGMGGGLEVHTWADLSPFANIARMIDLLALFIKIMLVSIVLISVMNVMVMAVYERIREIGTISAIGTPPRRILALFLTEGLLLGLGGAALGSAISLGLIYALNVWKVSVHFGMQQDAILLSPAVSALEVVTIGALVVGMALLASLQPAWKASRMDPVTALGHV